jgi:pimeloyl-ACP methyl ester carboxylesterase
MAAGAAGVRTGCRVWRDSIIDPLIISERRGWTTYSDPKEFLFFNRNAPGKHAAKAFVQRLNERTTDRDADISIRAFRTQLKAIKKFGRSTPADLSKLTQPTLIANGDNDRMVPSVLSEDLHQRITSSELGHEQVDLFGFSLGGGVAQAILLRDPKLVRRAILAGTGPAGAGGLEKMPLIAGAPTSRLR